MAGSAAVQERLSRLPEEVAYRTDHLDVLA